MGSRTLLAWGNGNSGALGLEDEASKSSPEQVGALATWSSVAIGYNHSLAIKTDGTLWSWGDYLYGQIGGGTWPNARSSPEQVGSLTTWSSVSAGQYSSGAIKIDGTLWMFGYNAEGELGLGDAIWRSSPVQVGLLTDWKSVKVSAGGDYTISVKTNGTLWSWGKNDHGQLGQEDTVPKSSPEQVGDKNDWHSVSVGLEFSAAVKKDGTLWTWGQNGFGQLGHGYDTVRLSSPEQVGTLTNWSLVTCGMTHTVALKTDGTLWSWGYGVDGQLGQGVSTFAAHRSSPNQIGSLNTWVYVNSFYYHTVAISRSGTAWSWGENGSGELGLEDTTDRSSPAQIGSDTNWRYVDCGFNQSLGIQAEQSIVEDISLDFKKGSVCWGRTTYSGINFEVDEDKLRPLDAWAGSSAVIGTGDAELIEMDSGEYQESETWNLDFVGPRGIRVNKYQGSGSTTIKYKTADTKAKCESGPTLWSWGRNDDGQLGHGDADDISSPEQVGALTTWSSVGGGRYHSAAIKTDGTLWTWGDNSDNGQLGLEDIADRDSPEQVGSSTNWSDAVAGGYYFTTAIKTNGTLWTWGDNGYGQLGLEDEDDRSSPEQVGDLTNWSYVGGGRYHITAVKTDGTLWAWGQNSSGQLGLEDQDHRSSPVQVGLLTDWSDAVAGGAAHTAAVKTDGTLWTWGNNVSGNLGLEDTADRSSPVQVGLLTDWSDAVACGGYYTAAIKTDGTFWTWGNNVDGQLGLEDSGAATPRSSPVQVGALTDWSSVTCGSSHTTALKTNGTLWTWGDSAWGQLGLEDQDDRSSPEQVGDLTNWSYVGGGDYHTLATRGDWLDYTGTSFESQGWVKVRLER